MPRVVAFLDKKGGVGKTSAVHHLGGTLARRWPRVLLVDADSQASLPRGLLGPEAAAFADEFLARPDARVGVDARRVA